MAGMSAVKLDLIQGSPEWLAARSDGIGSSDLPVIVGESPYRSALELWAEKTGLVPPAEVDPATRKLIDIGKRMEPVLLKLYAEETGRRARRVPQMLAHPQYPWARASLDGEANRRIVEVKWTHARRWFAGEAVPADVLIQVQWQMFVAGRDVADVVALVGPELRVVEVARDEAMIGDLLFFATDFWRHVIERTRPELDSSESTRRTLARIHPASDGTLLPSDPAIDALISDLRTAKSRAKEQESIADTIENALRALIGDADGIEGPWGRVTWRRNADSLRTNWPAVARAFRELLTDRPSDELDAIESIHSETVPGPRVLRLSSKGITE